MKKNPFKKKGIIDTLTNVGIGGAANVAVDYAVSNIEALQELDATTINAIKIGVGVLGGTMTNNKFIRAAVDGIAVVGVSNLVQSLVSDSTTTTGGSTSAAQAAMSGIPVNTIGRVRLGNKAYPRRAHRVSGIADSVMGK